ncbi:hypothetical protein [Polyangium spumosum]|uniref:Uncharacterized protein n=1 Tax=Polyangium spumosum TaxID=889282 RepID=A0A6N7PKJ2_9BACT|nr:hypothetical protein [Polyangium spumosum]MRG92538.1 hypothetical protein [Polyangium spumosum]
MSQIAWLFLHTNDVDRAREAATTLRERGEICAADGCGWVRFDRASIDSDTVCALGRRFSGALGCEVITIQSHSAVSWVRSTSYDRGEQVRVIEFDEDGWKCDGIPRSWESRLMADRASSVDDDCEPAVLAALSSGHIPEGALHPSCDAWDIVKCLGLEGLVRHETRRHKVGRWWWF